MSGYERREHPEFSWSHSRDKLLSDCRRAYYLRYYASHNGWERGAPSLARHAWALGKLLSVPSALGIALHERALECVDAVQSGHEIPSAAQLVQSTRAALNVLRSRRDRRAFLKDPKRLPMFREVYYCGSLRRQVVERTTLKIVTCVGNLRSSSLWDDLRRTLDAGGEVRVVDGFESFRLGDLTLYAAPDIVYRAGPDARPVIVDWKTGQLDGTIDQIAASGLLVRDHLAWPMSGGSYLARVVSLSDGQEHQFALDTQDLDEAEDRIRRSVSRMRSLLSDPMQNVARGADDAFPMNWGGPACRYCPYLELCREQMGMGTGEDLKIDAA